MLTQLINRTLLWLIAGMAVPGMLFSQDVTFSAPLKITAGYEKTEVLGKNSQGILIREVSRNDDEIGAYYDNLQLRWKKATPRKEKAAKLEQIVVYDDSLIFFYTETVKNVTLLKAFKTNSKLESLPLANVCDTINHSVINTTPAVNFAFTADKKKLIVYYEDAAFHTTNLIHCLCFDLYLHAVWKSSVKTKSMESPELVDAVVDEDGNVCIVAGNNTVKNFNNDFQYADLHVFSIRENGKKISETVFGEKNYYLTDCLIRVDMNRGNVLLAGLYASSAGTESDGTYWFSYQPSKDSVLYKKFEPHTTEFLAQLSGNNPPKKSDGFFDFTPTELIIKRDGGAILVTESQSVTTESYTSNNYGSFGMSSGFTVNYYHYDDLAVFSISPDGTLDWKQVLHKKQATEGDGGYYSSFVMVISPAALHFIYNDVINGQTSVAGYSLDVNGLQQRVDIFNADRKGVMVIPRSGKQISPNEVLLPSIKRNYLQFVKIGF